MGSSSRAPFVVVAAVVFGGAVVYAGKLASCAAHDGEDHDGGADVELVTDATSERRTAPAPTNPGTFDPCSRTEVVSLDGGEAGVTIVLPCRPYDPIVDTPDPPPK